MFRSETLQWRGALWGNAGSGTPRINVWCPLTYLQEGPLVPIIRLALLGKGNLIAVRTAEAQAPGRTGHCYDWGIFSADMALCLLGCSLLRPPLCLASSEDTRLRWHCVGLGRQTSGENLSGENLRA